MTEGVVRMFFPYSTLQSSFPTPKSKDTGCGNRIKANMENFEQRWRKMDGQNHFGKLSVISTKAHYLYTND